MLKYTVPAGVTPLSLLFLRLPKLAAAKSGIWWYVEVDGKQVTLFAEADFALDEDGFPKSNEIQARITHMDSKSLSSQPTVRLIARGDGLTDMVELIDA